MDVTSINVLDGQSPHHLTSAMETAFAIISLVYTTALLDGWVWDARCEAAQTSAWDTVHVVETEYVHVTQAGQEVTARRALLFMVC